MTDLGQSSDSPDRLLDCPLKDGSYSNARTVREFFVAVLRETWEHEKRVFGESDWRYGVYEAFAQAGLLDIKYDDMGYVESMDDETAERLVAEAIKGLAQAPLRGRSDG